MEFSGISGGGIMLALGAGLWLVYLVPSWLKRREFDATERNAVRLQQTLRILAETAEVPAPVRAETTARSVAENAKVLKQRQAVEDAAARARAASAALAAAKELAAVQPSGVVMREARARAALRLRRTRVVTSVILLVAVVVGIAQLFGFAAAPAVAPLVIGVSAAVVVSAIALLGRLSAVSRARARTEVRAPQRVVRKTSSVAAPVSAPVVSEQQREWTPVEIPKPLYLSRPAAEKPAVDATAMLSDLRAAAAAADAALRAAHEAPEIARIETATAVAAAPPSRFASMGIVDAHNPNTPDLDEVLRRRRQTA